MNGIRKLFTQKLSLENKKILITAGPTQEPIDPVRFITNRSSGKMGFAIAKVSKDYGGDVDLVTGPVHLPNIPQVNTIKIETALDMENKINGLLNTKKYQTTIIFLFMSWFGAYII